MPPREPIETRFLTVKNLLIVIATIAGLTLSLFAFQAERALDKLDRVDEATSTTATQMATMTSQMAAFGKRMDWQGARTDKIVNTLTDHEKRLIIIEAHDHLQTPR